MRIYMQKCIAKTQYISLYQKVITLLNAKFCCRADSARIEHVVELALDFANNHLKPNGALIVKAFHGSGYSQLVKSFKEHFHQVTPRKPKSSRDRSAETFLVGRQLKNASLR